MRKFCNLHQHSCYSYLDSMIRPEEMVKRCKELNYPAVVCTDHGHASATIKLHKECQKQGIKFIPASEVYMRDDEGEKDRKSYHLVILAQNNKGMENLFKILSYANTPNGTSEYGGFYYKPRISWESLEDHKEGIIVLTACMAGIVPRAFIKDGYEAGKKHVERFLTFLDRDHFFIELQNINDEKNDKIFIPEQIEILEYSRRVAKELNVRTVATTDSHWTYKSDIFNHEVLKTIESRMTVYSPKADPENGKRGRLIYRGEDYHLHSQEEMLAKFTEEEVLTSNDIVDSCNVNIELKQQHMPKFDEKMTDKEVYDKLRVECFDGFKKLGLDKSPNKQAYVNRMKVELRDIEEAGLQNYFMIVWDVVRFCFEKDIPTGKGRGSAAGSLTSYLLRITDVDPIEYGLIWERFWNRGRKGSMPDIDLDIAISRREEVIKYLREKFGEDRVYPMVTFSKLSTKAAIKDVGKALGLPFEYTNELSKHVPHKVKSIADAIEKNKYIANASKGEDSDTKEWNKEIVQLSKSAISKSSDIRKLREKIAGRKRVLKKTFEIATRLEDITRQRSSHACALLIADENIMGKIPLLYDPANKRTLTGFDMYDIEDMGYLKLDILGLKTLEVASRVHPEGARAVKEFKDPAVFQTIADGETKGVFQLESQLGRMWCKKIKPTRIEEVSDLIALIRPAVLETGLADEYHKNKKAGFASYIHKDFEPIFESTHGIMLYQEQMIEVAKIFAGFSLEKADKLRKACGHKLPEEMAKYKDVFIKGCVNNKYTQELGEELWSWTEKGAEYSFNKSHSMAYAMLSYTTAWMKHYHPKKFFNAMLQLSANEQRPHDEIAELFFDAKSFKVSVKSPSIKKGNADFEIIDGEIYYGLKHIKHVGNSSLRKVLKLKLDTWDSIYLNFKDIKKDVLKALIVSGAFDYLGMGRRKLCIRTEFLNFLTVKEVELFRCIYRGKTYNNRNKIKKFNKSADFNDAVNNLILFVNGENTKLKVINGARFNKVLKKCEQFLSNNPNDEYTIVEKATHELEYLGVPVTCSHVDVYADARRTHHVFEIRKAREKEGISTVATIGKLSVKTDKKKNEMAFITISDRTYMTEAIIFSRTYAQFSKILEEGKTYYFEGKKQRGAYCIDNVKVLN